MKTVIVRSKHISFIVLFACLLALLGPAGAAPAFAQTGYTLQITAGDNQSAPIATAFATPLQVTVTDDSGAGVAGVVVTFALPAWGPSLYVAPNATSFTRTTDANGVAGASVTANSFVGGPYQVVAGIEGASVAFNLTNAAAANPNALASYWMADPLDPGRPAPAAGTPPETAVPGWWWRDTTEQNALSQHTADQFTGQVIHAYHRDAYVYTGGADSAIDVWVYSSKAGSNVTLIMTDKKSLLVGCGGGGAEALAARAAFLANVPGFVQRTGIGAVLPDANPESYWGCLKWNLPNIYISSGFDEERVRSEVAGVEKTRRTSYTFGQGLPWGPDGNVGLGWARAYNPIEVADRPPTVALYETTRVLMEGVVVVLNPRAGSNLMVYLPPASGDFSDPDLRYGSFSGSNQAWCSHNYGLLVVGDEVGSYFPDQGSLATATATVSYVNADLGEIRSFHPGVLVMAHGLPVNGAAAIDGVVVAQRDALQYVYDQTLAGIDAGLTESEIAATVQLPPELAANPYNQEFVSGIPGVVRNVYHSTMGWFGGETPELASTLTTGVKAQILVDAYGGTANLIAAARTAELNARDLAGAEKALYLAYAAYKAAPDDFTAKQVYAQALRKNAFLQKSAPIRNYYLSEALHLGTEQIVTGLAKSGEEDATIAFTAADFQQHYFGISGAALDTVKITGLPEHGALALAGGAVAAGQEIPVAELDGLLFTPAADWNGSTSFPWNGKDGAGYCTDDATAAISILPVNDAPVISAAPLADLIVDEDAAPSSVDLSAGFADVDIATNADTLSYAVTSDNPAVSAAIDAGQLTLTYQANWNGAATLTATATDRAGATATDGFSVTVNPVNDAPTAADATVTVVAGKQQEITLDYGDLETAQANLQVVFGTLNGTLDASALPRLKYTAPATDGDDSFTYTVTDRGDPDGCSAAPCAAAASTTATVHVTVLAAPSGSISGAVFDDANANGALDAGEGGLAGVVVQLQDANGTQLETFTTAADGLYTFTGLSASSYQVYAPKAGDRVQTTDNPIAVTLAEAQAATGVNIGSVVSADLKVSMTYSVNNKTIIYAITVTNDGPADAANAVLTDLLPSTVAYVSVITTQGTCTGGKTVTCSFGTLTSGSSATVTIKVNRTDKNNPIENTATVTAGTFDIALTNNEATTTVP